jgi:para-nitrobenzyl esterase
VVDGDVRAFLGIPYAAPPTGARRWRPPAAVEAWSTTRDATSVGPACPQLHVPDYARADEDCLTLNVWVPDGGAPRKPVLVWIPGGAFVEGSGGYLLYDGARLAAREDAVVITMNYRVGALGFLASKELARELGRAASPSYGLLDQRAALQWVQRNAVSFGGDPTRVTIFGQSAGAFSVCAHLAMPASRGLFARAVMQSGSCADTLYVGAHEAEEQGQRFADALGCHDVDCLRSKDVAALLRALPLKRSFILPPGTSWGPVVDGIELPLVPLDALRSGRSAKVPVLIGWNRDEGFSHAWMFDAVTTAERDGMVRDLFGEAAVVPVAERYARGSVKEAVIDIITDGGFVCQARRAARALVSQGSPVYGYEFRRAFANPKLHAAGATHSVELWFLFGNEEAGIGLAPEEQPLSHAIMDAWGRFARTGDPAAADLRWPRYTADRDEIAVLDLPSSTAFGVKHDVCDFWDRFARPLR